MNFSALALTSLLTVFTWSAWACPDYYLLPDLSSAYEDPIPKKVELAQAKAVERFGHHDDLPYRERSKFSSTFFQRELKGLTLHAEALAALSCRQEKLRSCGFKGELTAGTDDVLGLHKLGLVIRLSEKSDCVAKILKETGFYPLRDDNFVFVGQEEVADRTCPYNMVSVKSKGQCIDKYEAPNVEGVKPFVARTAEEGIAYCKLQGKDLCTDVLWETACQNEGQRSPYPYGPTYKNGKCNDDKVWKNPRWGTINRYDPNNPDKDPIARNHVLELDQSEPSGLRPGCMTESGVFDLTGNAAEWVYNTKKKPNTVNGEVYTVAMKGCYWAKCLGNKKPSCAFTNSNHGHTFRSYEAGFRCCRPL